METFHQIKIHLPSREIIIKRILPSIIKSILHNYLRMKGRTVIIKYLSKKKRKRNSPQMRCINSWQKYQLYIAHEPYYNLVGEESLLPSSRSRTDPIRIPCSIDPWSYRIAGIAVHSCAHAPVDSRWQWRYRKGCRGASMQRRRGGEQGRGWRPP